MIDVITDRKFQQFSVFIKLTVSLVTACFIIIQGCLLLWVAIARKLYCPSCGSRSYGTRSTYGRSQDLLRFNVVIKWRIQRYSCKNCSKSFSSFTNTILSHHKSHPLIILLNEISSLINFSIRLPHLTSSFSTLELSYIQNKEQKHLSDAFGSTFLYFLQECLDEKLRRLCTGLFAIYFDDISKVHEITTMSRKTIRRGKKELLQKLEINTDDLRIRRSGGGRKSKIEEYQQMVLEIVEEYTAGDPMSRKKWMRISLRKLSDILGNILSHVSIGKILKYDGYSLLVNKKTKRSRKKHPHRIEQFDYIKQSVEYHQSMGNPVIAIDGKKTEKIGPFRRQGKQWSKIDNQIEVYDHDYSTLSEGKLVPFGIYDYDRNEGYIIVGTNLETTEFAVDGIVVWWEEQGSTIYDDCGEILITCDAGKPNSYRGYLFKYLLQTKFVDKFGITVHICHYPPGDSKYHIIERALFSFISMNLSGTPLYSYDMAMELIRSTTTKTGLSVKARLHDQMYERGISKQFSETDYKTINMETADTNPQFNYTIQPRNRTEVMKIRMEEECKRIDKKVWHFSNDPFDNLETGIKEANLIATKSEWKYHSLSEINYENKPIRADGRIGRPPEGCEMIDQYYITISFEVKEEYKGSHKVCDTKYT